MTVFLNFFSLRKYFVWMLYLVNYCNGKLRGIGGRKSNFWGRHRCFYLPDCRTLGAAPALLPDTRRCQGFRVRAVGASGATRLSYISARHGGGAAARVDFCSPVFLELWGYSGRTRLFPQVNISVLGGGGQDDEQSGRFSFSCLSLTRLFFPPLSTAKRRRVQPGCIPRAARRSSPGTGKLQVLTSARRSPNFFCANARLSGRAGNACCEKWAPLTAGSLKLTQCITSQEEFLPFQATVPMSTTLGGGFEPTTNRHLPPTSTTTIIIIYSTEVSFSCIFCCLVIEFLRDRQTAWVGW